MKKIDAEKNVVGYFPTEKDYQLVFCPVDAGDHYEWRELGHNIPKYNNMLLADYLQDMNICVPDFTQFLRIIDDERNLHFEYRCYGGRVRIDVKIDA